MEARRNRLAAYAWIEQEGQILLAKVAPGYADAGKWTLPGGGVDWGEHPEQTLHRELHEETGLSGTIDELLGIDSELFEPSEFNGYTSVHAVRLVFRVKASGDPRVVETGGSTSDVAWLPLSNVRDLPIATLVEEALKLSESAPPRP